MGFFFSGGFLKLHPMTKLQTEPSSFLGEHGELVLFREVVVFFVQTWVPQKNEEALWSLKGDRTE